jgi:hypothetical protein
VDDLKVPEDWQGLWLNTERQPDVDALVAGVLREAWKYRDRSLRMHDVVMVLTAILIVVLLLIAGLGNRMEFLGRLAMAAGLVVNMAGYWRFYRGMSDTPTPGSPSRDYVTHYLDYQGRLSLLLGWTFRRGSSLLVASGIFYTAAGWQDGNAFDTAVGIGLCLMWPLVWWATRYTQRQIEERQARLRAILESMGSR